MAITITIGGVGKSYVGGSLKFNLTANNHGTASFSVRSNDGSYRPEYDDEVIISQSGTPIFGGLIDKPGEEGTLGEATGAHDAIVTDVTVVDFSTYAARRYVTATLPAGTLKSMVTTLVDDYLSVYGITLSGSQPDGPTLPEVVCVDKLLADVFNDLSTLTAKYGEQYPWSVDPDKVFLMAAPSTEAAPFDIPGAYPVIGDIKSDKTGDRFANRVIVVVPSQSEPGRTETFDGDGSTTTFTLQYTPTDWNRGLVNVDGVDQTLNIDGDEQSASWTLDPVANTLTSNIGAPTGGAAISFTFNGVYTGRGDAQDASYATNPRERLIRLDKAPSDTTVQAYAEGLLARCLSLGRTVKYKTFGTGLRPGMSQHITFAPRDLDDDVIITSVSAEDYGLKGHRLLYSVTAVTGSIIPEQFQDTYRLWAGDTGGGGSSTVTVGAGSPTPSAPGNPDTSVQFNDSGRFGGHEAFTFAKVTQTVMIGTGHTPDGQVNFLFGEGHTVN